MSLVHYGFSREEAVWMPITEMQDYIQLINSQVDAENDAENGAQKNNAPHEKTDTPTFSDVFKGLRPGL